MTATVFLHLARDISPLLACPPPLPADGDGMKRRFFSVQSEVTGIKKLSYFQIIEMV